MAFSLNPPTPLVISKPTIAPVNVQSHTVVPGQVSVLPRPDAPKIVVNDVVYEFDGVFVSATEPVGPNVGDLWIDLGENA